jgi:hypothetical protein
VRDRSESDRSTARDSNKAKFQGPFHQPSIRNHIIDQCFLPPPTSSSLLSYTVPSSLVPLMELNDMSDSNDQPLATSPSMPSADPLDSSEESNAALSQRGPILPVELVNLVARFLYDSRSLKTIAQLNRTSKTVREETLGVLYETVVYKCVPSFARTVSFDAISGWRYTK